jgi:hypothetical protein
MLNNIICTGTIDVTVTAGLLSVEVPTESVVAELVVDPVVEEPAESVVVLAS